MLANAFSSRSVVLGRSRCTTYRTFVTSAIRSARSRHLILEGRHTHESSTQQDLSHKTRFFFETGYSLFAKRPSRPFPPPFVSAPSGSFSDPLTTHDRVKYRQPKVDGRYLGGITNGDDAIIISRENFLAVNDGVGAWAQKERGHAALWSRLIAHYWALEVEKVFEGAEKYNPSLSDMNTIAYLQTAYESTINATKTQTAEILGTTTASSALLHHNPDGEPVVLATQLGDCALIIIRPPASPLTESDINGITTAGDGESGGALAKAVLYKTQEQWHWFDCPRQLGTNSPDTPNKIAICDNISVKPSDIIVCMSDGVTDNLWEHEIVAKTLSTYFAWRAGEAGAEDGPVYMARELMTAARVVAQDPYAESPYMERALDEGIAAEGGKLDDISVIIGIVRDRENKEEARKSDDPGKLGPTSEEVI